MRPLAEIVETVEVLAEQAAAERSTVVAAVEAADCTVVADSLPCYSVIVDVC